jgi:hypothetical protein
MRSAPDLDRHQIAEIQGSAEPNRASGGPARRAGAFLLRDFRQILPPTVFFSSIGVSSITAVQPVHVVPVNRAGSARAH